MICLKSVRWGAWWRTHTAHLHTWYEFMAKIHNSDAPTSQGSCPSFFQEKNHIFLCVLRAQNTNLLNE